MNSELGMRGRVFEETLVSVIIPTRNRPALLREALGSVLSQTWPHFELIIVDDASDKDTASAIEDFRDMRVLSVRNEVPQNAAAARNIGVAVARGELISFLDDDDLYRPEKLLRTVEAFSNAPRAGVVLSGFDVGGTAVLPCFRGQVFDKLTARFFTVPTSVIAVRRAVFNEVGGFDASMTPSEDLEFCLRAARLTEFASIAEPLVVHRQHSGGRLIDDADRAEKSFTRMVTKNLGDGSGGLQRRGQRLLQSWKAAGHAQCARQSADAGDGPGARRHSRAALRLEPLSTRRWAQAALYHLMPSATGLRRALRRRRVKL